MTTSGVTSLWSSQAQPFEEGTKKQSMTMGLDLLVDANLQPSVHKTG